MTGQEGQSGRTGPGMLTDQAQQEKIVLRRLESDTVQLISGHVRTKHGTDAKIPIGIHPVQFLRPGMNQLFKDMLLFPALARTELRALDRVEHTQQVLALAENDLGRPLYFRGLPRSSRAAGIGRQV